MKELLTDLLEYMEQRADADGSGDGFTPNKEMGFQIRIEEALAELSTEGLKLSDDLVVKSLAAIHKSEQPDLPAPNTVMWWLCRIADDKVRRKAVGNVTNKSKLIEEEPDFENAVYSAFEWSSKEEGHDYWKAVAISEPPLLPEPEFKEYLEIRK